jgi:hypothetical protein
MLIAPSCGRGRVYPRIARAKLDTLVKGRRTGREPARRGHARGVDHSAG